eukprot:1351030-Pleurochrysis_carterae.AAC.7
MLDAAFTNARVDFSVQEGFKQRARSRTHPCMWQLRRGLLSSSAAECEHSVAAAAATSTGSSRTLHASP